MTQDEMAHVAVSLGALLLEVAGIDGEFSEAELRRILFLVGLRFGMDEAGCEVLLEKSALLLDRTSDLMVLSAAVLQTHTPRQRAELLGDLWDVAFADGIVDRYEQYLMNRLSELLEISQEHLQAQKRAAHDRMN